MLEINSKKKIKDTSFLQSIQTKIQRWKETYKEAMKSGSPSKTRRLRKKISNYKKLLINIPPILLRVP